jgi:hypothetical protein
MKVINVHKRIVSQPKSAVEKLFNTLASDNDLMLATDKWPPMKLDKGLSVGSRGGHGPIKYFVTDYHPGNSITFRFDLSGFIGSHRFELTPLSSETTAMSHSIVMRTEGLATLKWMFAIRWLHDAYIEDAFDKVENYFTPTGRRNKWNWWVRLLRKGLRPRRLSTVDNSIKQ